MGRPDRARGRGEHAARLAVLALSERVPFLVTGAAGSLGRGGSWRGR
ncbi:MAG: hypothetical protein KIT31_31320 [Deltaproteobacteria bacterium]|nr:hypothetical protein [Deltaproteobacteria bacterium]